MSDRHRKPGRDWNLIWGRIVVSAGFAAIATVVILLGVAISANTPAVAPQAAVAADASQAAGTVVCDPATIDANGDFAPHCHISLASPAPTPTSTATPSPTSTGTPTSGPSPTQSPSPTATTPPPSPTPTATPSPSSTFLQCLPKPSVCGLPDATNTGVPAGTKLTAVSGDVHVTVAGTVLSGQDITGCVIVDTNNVTIMNSRINCPRNSAIQSSTGKSASNMVVRDSEIICGTDGNTGVSIANFTATRLNVHGCENGFDPGSGSTIQDTYVHDLNTCCSNHPDGIQLGQGVGNLTIRHNTLIAPITNAALIMWDENDPQNHDVLVDGNLLAGGGFTLYCPRMPSTNVVVTNNRFGNSNFGPTSQCTIGHVAQWSGNIFDATGAVVPAA
jgi:hypothetical protein